MERRLFLKGAAATTAALVPASASAADAPQGDLAAALARFRASIPSNFDRTYVENAVVPFFLSSIYQGERPALPMIDLAFTKENALPADLWGLIYEGWAPAPEQGVTVFLQGLEERGDHNLRKRIYMSAVTPDLYRPMYGDKVVAFFDQLLDPRFAGKPFMRHYLDYYFDIYWDLHLGVKGEAIPPQVRTIGESFNTVLAFRDPTQPIVYENYMTVRALLNFLKSWIDERLDDVANGHVADPEKTIAWYWLKNAGNGEHFSKKDVVFECFHNFVALQPMGQHDLRHHVAAEPGWRRCRRARVFREDHGRRLRQRERRALHAARAVRDGTVPHDLAERRQHLRARGCQASECQRQLRRWRVATSEVRTALRAAQLHQHAAYLDQLRPAALAAIRCTSIPSATGACRPAIRSTRPNAGRSALPAAPSTSPRSR